MIKKQYVAMAGVILLLLGCMVFYNQRAAPPPQVKQQANQISQANQTNVVMSATQTKASTVKQAPSYKAVLKKEPANKQVLAAKQVFDKENLFSNSNMAKLNQKLTQYKKVTTREVVVLTTATIAPYEDIAAFATATANDWGIGDAKKNNGLFIVVSKQLKSVYIATGLGTEKILTNDICQQVINEYMLPAFKQGDFYKGVDAGIESLMAQWHE